MLPYLYGRLTGDSVYANGSNGAHNGRNGANLLRRDARYTGAHDCASALGVDESTFGKWARSGIVQKNQATGMFDVLEVLQHKEIYDLERSAGLWERVGEAAAEPVRPNNLPANMVYAWESAELTRVRREIEKIRLEKLRGSVVDREAVTAAVETVLGAVKGQVLAQADALVPRLVGLDPKGMRRVIREHSRQLLESLAATAVVEDAVERVGDGGGAERAAGAGRNGRGGAPMVGRAGASAGPDD